MITKDIARYDKGIVQGQNEITEEGFIKAKAIVTRCGVFFYKNADGTIRRELRHPDDVLVKESLESMKMIPVVNGHPPERLVTSENSKRLSVGYTGELVEKDLPYIIANMVITDKTAVEQIKDKINNELSLGYTVDLVEESGTYFGEPYDYRQTNIRYNHLALVDQARAGPEAKIALDGLDAEEVKKEDLDKMAKKTRKVKIDSEEYMLEDEAANSVDKMIAEKNSLLEQKDKLEARVEELENMLDKAHAERDSLRDKDYHDPEEVHHPMSEEDEVGPEGKEMIDPLDAGGMQSHVRDYQKPSQMENHVVKNPKNEHYPRDLPHVAKVDQADINARVRQRVKLEKLSEKYLDKSTLSRIDSLTDLEIKKSIIKSLQPAAQLNGKSEVYINARFDSICEDLPEAKVIAQPSRYNADADMEKERCDATEARRAMIARHKNSWKPQRG